MFHVAPFEDKWFFVSMGQLNPQKIRDLIELRGTNANALSIEVFGKRETLRPILSGRQKNTTPQRAQLLADALGVPVAELYDENDGNDLRALRSNIENRLGPDFLDDLKKSIMRETLQSYIDVAQRKPAVRKRDPELIEVPEHDVRVSAGPGTVITEEPIRRTWGVTSPVSGKPKP